MTDSHWVIPPKRKDEKPRLLQLSMRMPSELLQQCDEIAKETGYTRSQVIVFLLKAALVRSRRPRKPNR